MKNFKENHPANPYGGIKIAIEWRPRALWKIQSSPTGYGHTPEGKQFHISGLYSFISLFLSFVEVLFINWVENFVFSTKRESKACALMSILITRFCWFLLKMSSSIWIIEIVSIFTRMLTTFSVLFSGHSGGSVTQEVLWTSLTKSPLLGVEANAPKDELSLYKSTKT